MWMSEYQANRPAHRSSVPSRSEIAPCRNATVGKLSRAMSTNGPEGSSPSTACPSAARCPAHRPVPEPTSRMRPGTPPAHASMTSRSGSSGATSLPSTPASTSARATYALGMSSYVIFLIPPFSFDLMSINADHASK